MGPRIKRKKRQERFKCDDPGGERFHATVEDVFRYNWWEVFCFPYIMCARVWECCMSMCAGTNQCFIYWMMIQWVVCKITRLTTPDPIIFPYYFYMFCQVILLTAFFFYLWSLIGKSVLIPYFKAYYEAFKTIDPETKKKNKTIKIFRRYCFRKGEIFDSSLDEETNAGSMVYPSYITDVLAVVVDILIFELFS